MAPQSKRRWWERNCKGEDGRKAGAYKKFRGKRVDWGDGGRDGVQKLASGT